MDLGKQTRLLTERVIRETKRLRNACKMAKCRNSKAGASKEPFEVDCGLGLNRSSFCFHEDDKRVGKLFSSPVFNE
jgi:hypothetical protein